MSCKLSIFSLIITSLLTFSFANAQTDTCESGRPIVHAGGTACVPENVERVVALEWTYAEDLLALGVQPVGIADIEGYQTWVKIPVELSEDVVAVGTRNEPNLELITQLNPDLIIAVSHRVAQNLTELEAIAPVLIFDPYPTDGTSHFDEMTATFNTIAEAVNRQEEAEAGLANLDAHLEAAAEAIEAAGRGGETFIISQAFASSEVPTFRLFTDNAMAVELLYRLGWENAWQDEPQFYGFSQVTIESFAEVGDTNFLYVAQDDFNELLTDSPLWNSLPFVQADHAYWMGGDVWLFGGPLGAEVLVDTILELLEIPVLPEATPEATPEAGA